MVLSDASLVLCLSDIHMPSNKDYGLIYFSWNTPLKFWMEGRFTRVLMHQQITDDESKMNNFHHHFLMFQTGFLSKYRSEFDQINDKMILDILSNESNAWNTYLDWVSVPKWLTKDLGQIPPLTCSDKVVTKAADFYPKTSLKAYSWCSIYNSTNLKTYIFTPKHILSGMELNSFQ